MSGSRSRDPFNFDDIYRQAGVEDLFVKKTMSEMKKTVPPAQPASRPENVKAVSNGSIPAVSSQHSSPRVFHSTENRPVVTSSSPGLVNDPFAGLGLGQFSSNNSTSQSKMSVPVPRISSPRKPQNDIDLSFLGPGQPSKPSVSQPSIIEFDDIFGTAAPKPAANASASVDPFALFEAIPGASAPVITPPASISESVSVGLAEPAQPRYPVVAAPIRHENDVETTTSFQQVDSNRSSRIHGSSSSKSLHSASSSSTPRASNTSISASSQLGAAPPPPPSYDQAVSAPSASFTQQQSFTSHSFHEPTPDDSTQGYSSQSSRGTTTIGGVLMKFGKKVTKVAKDGLATLNDALERLDHAEKYGAPRPYRFSSKDEEEVDFPAEKALTYAIEISEMPPRQQEEVMGRLPHHIRVKVAQILREQAMAEAEGPVSHDLPVEASSQVNPAPSPPEPEVVHTREFRLDDETAAASHSPRPSRSPPRAQPSPKPVAPPPQDEDLLGISTPIPATASVSAAAPSPVAVQDDLLGFDTAPAPAKPVQAAAPINMDVDSVTDFFGGGAPPAATTRVTVRHTATPSSESLDAFFSGGEKPAAPKPVPAPAARQTVLARPAVAPQAKAPPPMFQDRVDGVVENHAPVRVSTGPVLQDHDDDPNEPEIRKQLRAQRIADRDRKMQAALEEKLAKEQAEAKHRELQVQLKERYKEDIIAWKNKNKDNVRGLLGSLQTVLWENSGWQPVGMADLLEPAQVRKAWMKANLIVHPDKVRQKNGTPDQIAIADMVFDVLKEAWGKFQR